MKPIPFNLESTNKKPFWEVKASMEEKTGDVFIYGHIASLNWCDVRCNSRL